MKAVLMFLMLGCMASCQDKSAEKRSVYRVMIPKPPNAFQEICDRTEAKKEAMDSLMAGYNLVDVRSVNSGIQVALKYASDDNFMGMVLYERLRTVYVQRDVAGRLSDCQLLLDSLLPGHSLLIYDGVRPLETQQKMWDALDSIPVVERSRFVSNPSNRSLHNFGAAVDVTIIDPEGVPLDMGAGYDDIRKIAYPSMEQHFLATGELSMEQLEHRKLLRKIMRYRGFTPIESEWWHFNACSRAVAKGKYMLLEKEPVVY